MEVVEESRLCGGTDFGVHIQIIVRDIFQLNNLPIPHYSDYYFGDIDIRGSANDQKVFNNIISDDQLLILLKNSKASDELIKLRNMFRIEY